MTSKWAAGAMSLTVAYFAYHAFAGEQGLGTWTDKQTELAEKKQHLAALEAENAALQKVIHGVPPEEHDRVSHLMSALPQPSPLYTLRLQQENQEDKTVDIWQLCYQVCSVTDELADEIEADDSLFDESGEVDWRVLDDKTFDLVATIFGELPTRDKE